MRKIYFYLLIISLSISQVKRSFGQDVPCFTIMEDFESNRKLGNFYYPVSNLAPNSVNPSSMCGAFDHYAQSWEEVSMSFPYSFSDDFKKGIKVFTVNVYSPAAGIPVSIHLKNVYKWTYPDEYHSGYIAYTTKANQWEKLTFKYYDNGFYLPQNQVNEIRLGFTGGGYYWDRSFTVAYDNINYEFTASAITVQPVDATVAANASSEFSVVADVDSYQWQVSDGSGFVNIKNAGIYSGATTAKLSISSASSQMHGYLYRCVLTEESCTISSAAVKLSIDQASKAPVCFVTVDSTFKYNQVIWETANFSGAVVDSFVVYREIASDEYKRIGAVPYSQSGLYNDMGANPSSTGFRYKITYKNKSGKESDQSLYHNTVFLVYLGSGSFFWTPYEVENTGNPVKNYDVYRDNSSNGIFIKIGTTTGSQRAFTDNDYGQYPNASYYVKAVLNYACTGFNKTDAAINTTRSNIKNNKFLTYVQDRESAAEVLVYPNPAQSNLSVKYKDAGDIIMMNALGQVVYSKSNKHLFAKENMAEINTASFPRGVYFLKVSGNNTAVVKKVVLE